MGGRKGGGAVAVSGSAASTGEERDAKDQYREKGRLAVGLSSCSYGARRASKLLTSEHTYEIS